MEFIIFLPLQETGKMEFDCKFCTSKWLSHLSLELHIMESHHKVILVCHTCGNFYKGKAELQRHIESQHLGKIRMWDIYTLGRKVHLT